MKDEENYGGGLWDDSVFNENPNSQENEGALRKDDDHRCRKCGKKISALGKGYDAQLCNECFDEELARE